MAVPANGADGVPLKIMTVAKLLYFITGKTNGEKAPYPQIILHHIPGCFLPNTHLPDTALKRPLGFDLVAIHRDTLLPNPKSDAELGNSQLVCHS